MTSVLNELRYTQRQIYWSNYCEWACSRALRFGKK